MEDHIIQMRLNASPDSLVHAFALWCVNLNRPSLIELAV
jgi:hypothetical protein